MAFQAAVDLIRSLPKSGPIPVSNDDKLEFYALFKQATLGDNTASKPGGLKFEARAKWEAWESVKGTPAETVKAQYVAKLVEMAKANGHEWNPPA